MIDIINKINKADLKDMALKTGLSKGLLSKIKSGKRGITPKTALCLFVYWNGEVKITDIIYPAGEYDRACRKIFGFGIKR